MATSSAGGTNSSSSSSSSDESARRLLRGFLPGRMGEASLSLSDWTYLTAFLLRRPGTNTSSSSSSTSIASEGGNGSFTLGFGLGFETISGGGLRLADGGGCGLRDAVTLTLASSGSMGSLGGVRSDDDGGDVDAAAGADLGVLVLLAGVAFAFGVALGVAATEGEGAGALGFGAPKNAESVVCFVLCRISFLALKGAAYAFFTSAAALTIVNGASGTRGCDRQLRCSMGKEEDREGKDAKQARLIQPPPPARLLLM